MSPQPTAVHTVAMVYSRNFPTWAGGAHPPFSRNQLDIAFSISGKIEGGKIRHVNSIWRGARKFGERNPAAR